MEKSLRSEQTKFATRTSQIAFPMSHLNVALRYDCKRNVSLQSERRIA